jgi:hypothetical protein
VERCEHEVVGWLDGALQPNKAHRSVSPVRECVCVNHLIMRSRYILPCSIGVGVLGICWTVSPPSSLRLKSQSYGQESRNDFAWISRRPKVLDEEVLDYIW